MIFYNKIIKKLINPDENKSYLVNLKYNKDGLILGFLII